MPLTALFAGGARPRCYVASPLGFTEGGREYYAEQFLPALVDHVEPVDPWTLSLPAEFEEAASQGRAREFGIEVGTRNAEAIRSSELLIALLEGQEVDAGTAAEVGYGAALGLPCIGVRSDLRASGEPGMRVNLQLEAFVELSGGFIASSLGELLARLAALRSAAGGERADITALEAAAAAAAGQPLDVTAAQVRLASAYQRDQMTEHAVALDEQIAATLRELLGSGHPATVAAADVIECSQRLLRSSPDRPALARRALELRAELVARLDHDG